MVLHGGQTINFILETSTLNTVALILFRESAFINEIYRKRQSKDVEKWCA